jgi:hypothetical protein
MFDLGARQKPSASIKTDLCMLIEKSVRGLFFLNE